MTGSCPSNRHEAVGPVWRAWFSSGARVRTVAPRDAYVWHKVIRFQVGPADAPVRTATIRLTYAVGPVSG